MGYKPHKNDHDGRPQSQEVGINEKVILVRINKLYREFMTEEEMYEATRGIWRVGPRRNEADYAFTVYQGFVKEIYKINRWYPACTLEYKTRPMLKAIQDVKQIGRWEFDGMVAENNIRDKYIGRSIKSYLPSFGGANPIIYINC